MNEHLLLGILASIGIVGLVGCGATSSPRHAHHDHPSHGLAPSSAKVGETGPDDDLDDDDDENEVPVAIADVPASIRAAAEQVLPGIQFTEAERETENGVELYSLEGTLDGELWEVEVGLDGTVLEVEREGQRRGND